MPHHAIRHHEDRLHEEHAGEHLPGHTRLMEEEHRKNAFFHEFHSNREHLNENHGHDRNRMGHHDPMRNYDHMEHHRS